MNRKGKLTTKGKHGVILTLTIVACVAAMLFSLLLSVLCDGKHVSSAAHTQNDTHPGIMAGSQRQETDLLTPQWLYYQSNGSVTDCNIKKEMDVLMRKWTKGKLGGKELDRLIKEFLQKKDCPVCVTDKSKCTGKAPEPPAETSEPEKEKPAGLNPAALILLLALLGGGGVFAYLKLVKNKPKTKGNDSLDDYDYGEEDSEEWETEDEEVLEDGFEGSDPNEERDRAD